MKSKETSGIIRTVKKEDPYVRIFNSVFSDDRISYKAKGILAYLLSKPNNWETKISDLYLNSIEGYDSIRSGISELILSGYMELKNILDNETGKFTGRYYVVREIPLFASGYRLLENKNKSFSESEIITKDNPFGNRKVLKVKRETINEDNPY